MSDLLNDTLPLAPVNVTLSVNVETPVAFTRPSMFPVTLPVTLPVTFPVTSPVTGPAIAPTKLEAVIIPDARMFPIELIPTPSLPAAAGSPPT